MTTNPGRHPARKKPSVPETEASPTRWWVSTAITVIVWDVMTLGATALHLIASRLDAQDAWWAVFDSREIWSGRLDGSVAETFGNLQLMAAALLLFLCAIRSTRQHVLVVWGVLFLLVAADDFFRLHELIGITSGDVSGPLTLAVLDDGDAWLVLLAAGAAVVLVLLLLLAHLRSSGRARQGSSRLAAATLLLCVFAVGVDFLSDFVHGPHGGVLYSVVTYVETTGELLAMSLVLIIALVLFSGAPSRVLRLDGA